MFIGPIVLAAALATPAVDQATRTAITTAVRRAGIADACDAAATHAAIAGAQTKGLGKIGSDRVMLVGLQAQCVCGNVNCPYLVLQVGSAGSKTLLVTSAYDVKVVPSTGEPLPRLREEAHDSALITNVSVDAYRGDKYQAVEVYRRRNDTGARKPDSIPVSFAAGSSSARLNGTVSLGWYDRYTFAANRGQTLTVDGLSPKSKLRLALETPAKDGTSLTVTPGTAIKLPAAGTYHVIVDTDSEANQPYAFTLAIR